MRHADQQPSSEEVLRALFGPAGPVGQAGPAGYAGLSAPSRPGVPPPVTQDAPPIQPRILETLSLSRARLPVVVHWLDACSLDCDAQPLGTPVLDGMLTQSVGFVFSLTEATLTLATSVVEPHKDAGGSGELLGSPLLSIPRGCILAIDLIPTLSPVRPDVFFAAIQSLQDPKPQEESRHDEVH